MHIPINILSKFVICAHFKMTSEAFKNTASVANIKSTFKKKKKKKKLKRVSTIKSSSN